MTKFMTYPAQKTSKSLLIVMPTYNEEEHILDVVETWHQVAQEYQGNLLIVADGPKDQTLIKLLEHRGLYPHMIILQKPNSGHGPSCLVGYEWGIQNDYEWIFQTDSDGQTDPQDFPLFWNQRQESPFQFGVRLDRGDGKFRKIVSFFLRSVVYLVFRQDVRDSNVPFRLMKTSLLPKALSLIPKNMYLSNSLITVVLAQEHGIRWNPISFHPRNGGEESVKAWKFVKVGLQVYRDFRDFRRSLQGKTASSSKPA